MSIFSHVFKLAFALIVAFFLSTAPSSAQSACKGLKNSTCVSKDSCSWVKAFTRSDGAKVKSFCRSKPGKSPTKKKTTTKKKAVKKETAAQKKKSTDKKSTGSGEAPKNKTKDAIAKDTKKKPAIGNIIAGQ